MDFSTNVLISVCEYIDIGHDIFQRDMLYNCRKVLLCCYITGLVISPWDRLLNLP